MKLFAVGLHHGDSVVTSFKYLNLINRLQPASGKVSLPGDEDGRLHPFNCYFLIQVGVLKETFQFGNQWTKPYLPLPWRLLMESRGTEVPN